MTLNGLEIKKYCKNSFILFLFFSLHNFLIFCNFIFRIIFGRFCYGTTVHPMALTRQIGATNGPAGRSSLLVAYISKYGWATTLVLHMTFVSLWLISFIDYVLTGFVL